MAETDESETGTLTLGKCATQRGLDSALLRLLADGGHVPTASVRRGTHRLPEDSPLTVEEAERKGRAACDQQLEAVGRLVMKTRSRTHRLLEERLLEGIEEQQKYRSGVLPLRPGLSSAADGVSRRDKHHQETVVAGAGTKDR